MAPEASSVTKQARINEALNNVSDVVSTRHDDTSARLSENSSFTASRSSKRCSTLVRASPNPPAKFKGRHAKFNFGLRSRSTASAQPRVSKQRSRENIYAAFGTRAVSEEERRRREQFSDWRQRRVFGCFAADRVTSRSRLLVIVMLQVTASFIWHTAAVVIACIAPARSAAYYAAWAVLGAFKLAGTAFGLLDFNCNVVEYRRSAQVLYSELVGLLGRRHDNPGRFLAALRPSGRGAYIPKSPARLMADFFAGWPTGTFMVSYCWAADVELPRRVAIHMLPEVPPAIPNKCWLDVENLLPGSASVPEMVKAVRHARFRFVFLSAAYLKSANCLEELNALRHEPGRSLFLVYQHCRADGTSLAPPAKVVEELVREGHLVHLLPSELHDFTRWGAADLLYQLNQKGVLHMMFREVSPRINAQWLATAVKLCEPNRSHLARALLRFAHCIFLPIVSDALLYLWMLGMASNAAGADAFGSLHASLRLLGSSAAGLGPENTATALNIIVALALAFDMLYVLSVTLALPLVYKASDPALREMPDAGLLLLVLRKLDIGVGGVHVCNVADPSCDGGGGIARVLRTLQAQDVISLVTPDDVMGTDHVLFIIDLDAYGLEREPPRVILSQVEDAKRGLEHCCCWSVAKGFEAIAGKEASWGALVQHTIVGCPEESDLMVEAILCKLLSLVLANPEDPAAPPTKLVPGGTFRVDSRRLAPPEDTSSSSSTSQRTRVGTKGEKRFSRRAQGSRRSELPPHATPVRPVPIRV